MPVSLCSAAVKLVLYFKHTPAATCSTRDSNDRNDWSCIRGLVVKRFEVVGVQGWLHGDSCLFSKSCVKSQIDTVSN